MIVEDRLSQKLTLEKKGNDNPKNHEKQPKREYNSFGRACTSIGFNSNTDKNENINFDSVNLMSINENAPIFDSYMDNSIVPKTPQELLKSKSMNAFKNDLTKLNEFKNDLARDDAWKPISPVNKQKPGKLNRTSS